MVQIGTNKASNITMKGTKLKQQPNSKQLEKCLLVKNQSMQQPCLYVLEKGSRSVEKMFAK